MVQFLQETGKDEIKVRKNTVFCASEACFVLSCDPLEGSSHRLGTTDLHELTFAPITIVYLIIYVSSASTLICSLTGWHMYCNIELVNYYILSKNLY